MVFFYIVLAIIGLLVILGLIAPKSYDVSRSIEINKPLPEVFQYLKYIKNQDYWSPWKKKDPNMLQEFEGIDGEVGFVSKWEGNKEVGSGEQEILGIVDNKVIETELRFLKPWKSQSDAYIKVEEISPNETKVIWGFTGKNKFPMSILMLFMNMEKAVGKDFEEGLENLKQVLEN
ncbi:MAG: SRPBCC family protein [Flavobacteriaceae bacterium]|nr:SRPBCC family protein [Flavobacteriaceae bacterium]